MKTPICDTTRYTRRILLVMILAGATALLPASASAEGFHEQIPQLFLWLPMDAIVLAHFDANKKNTLLIEKSYYGQFKIGDEVEVTANGREEFELPSIDADQNNSQEFLLFLDRKHLDKPSGYKIPVGVDWKTYTLACRRIVSGKVYDWQLREISGTPPYVVDEKNPLVADDEVGTLNELESQISYGLSLRDGLSAAKAATVPQKKLALLHPFLVPSEDGRFTPYMVNRMTSLYLDEADETGAAAIPFYEALLKLPSYQSDFNPDEWIGYGAQERIQVEQRLHLQKARLESDPTRKLAELAPLFVLPKFAIRAGCDGDDLLDHVMDKALAAVETAGPAAIPFLQELLTKPWFEDAYSPHSWDVGHARRQKIEATLARLQTNG